MSRYTLSAAVLALTLSLSGSAFAQDVDLAPTTDETVYFRGWQYKTDIVQDNVRRYNEELAATSTTRPSRATTRPSWRRT